MGPALVCSWIVAPALHLTLLCVISLALLSFTDDLRPLPAFIRFVVHFLAASTLVHVGYTWTSTVIALGMTLALVWMTNLYNFMDGSDGLAGGMALFGFSTYALIAWHAGEDDMAQASAAMAACSAAFLIFNFHPARIFMGDIGSIPLGFLAAAFGLEGWHRNLWPAWLPVLAFSPFIVDASLTLGRRIIRREKIWQAHRNHYYQRMVRMGLGHRNTALAEYLLMALAAASAVRMVDLQPVQQLFLLLAWAALYTALAFFIDRRWQCYMENA